jgi:hypothetical protein
MLRPGPLRSGAGRRRCGSLPALGHRQKPGKVRSPAATRNRPASDAAGLFLLPALPAGFAYGTTALAPAALRSLLAGPSCPPCAPCPRPSCPQLCGGALQGALPVRFRGHSPWPCWRIGVVPLRLRSWEAGGCPALPPRHRNLSLAQAATTSTVTMNRARPRPKRQPGTSLGHRHGGRRPVLNPRSAMAKDDGSGGKGKGNTR